MKRCKKWTMATAATVALLVGLTGAQSAFAADAVVLNGSGLTGTSGALTLTWGTRTLNCTSNSLAGNWLSYANGAYPITISSSFAPVLATCTIVGGLRPTVSCRSTTTGYFAVAAASVLDVTSATLTVDCAITLSMTCSVQLTGRIPGSYDNTTQKWTTGALAGQTLALTGSTCVTLPNSATATWSDAAIRPLVYQLPSDLRLLSS